MSSTVIAFTSSGTVDALFNRSLLELLLWEQENGHTRVFRPQGDIISVRSGPRIATARNAIVRRFLSTTAEWLWMLDTDMVFKPDTLDQLLDVADPNDHPIVGALCFGGGYTTSIFPTLYVYDKEQGIGTLNDYPLDELVSVDATGAACMVVHRSVFEELAKKHAAPQEWFAESVWDNKEVGEDITFCIRARTIGLPIYVHTGIEVGHVKPLVLDSEEWVAQKKLSKDQINERRKRKMRLPD
jgi:GT2 family glycosyltransferase